MKAVNVDEVLKILYKYGEFTFVTANKKYSDMVDDIANLKAVEQESSDDCINRQAVKEFVEYIQTIKDKHNLEGSPINYGTICDLVSRGWKLLESEKVIYGLCPVGENIYYCTKIRYCRNCRWWKDSDGIYRRGIEAESKCPMNRKEVYEGNGYCYMFELKESEASDEHL